MSEMVLIVEDEEKLANLLVDYFALTDYQTHIIGEGTQVIDWVKVNQPAVILLDLMLPGKNGIDICKEIRQFSNVPILMLTARVEEVDRLLGLELGADDYICKPYSPREVVARVKTVLRRTQNHVNVTVTNKLELDESRFVAIYNGQEVSLTSVEFQMLKLLNDRPNSIFNREQLMNAMYTDYRVVNNRTVDSHIKKLRKKLDDISQGEEIIQSVYGVGYRVVV